MVRAMTEALQDWRETEQVQTVLVAGAGERGLCAGGDIRALYDAAKAGDESLLETFWGEEYRLNVLLAEFPKPVVGIMDGICMGGGVGVSAHGSHRVVTERSKVGMPEVGIGFAPDVGGTFLLARAPGELGTHLALTGAPVGGADAVLCGLADYYISSDNLGDLATALESGSVDATLEKFAEQPPTAPLEADREWIDAVYSAGTVEEIVRRLSERPETAAQAAAETIATKSPTSLKVTLRALREARAFSTLEQALDQEFRVSLACARVGDFVEGVRATLVDKDRDPQWSPARLDEVDDAHVEQFFASLGARELGLSS
jgi:enoyl-CoA hydratase